jgi:hypothetical protein
MDDPQIHGSIERLVAEERELWGRESDGSATDDDRRRLPEIRVSLDQCRDLLRQRRARRDAGQNPETAAARPSDIVEGYQQWSGLGSAGERPAELAGSGSLKA